MVFVTVIVVRRCLYLFLIGVRLKSSEVDFGDLHVSKAPTVDAFYSSDLPIFVQTNIGNIVLPFCNGFNVSPRAPVVGILEDAFV